MSDSPTPHSNGHNGNGSAHIEANPPESLDLDGLLARISERLIALPAAGAAGAEVFEKQEDVQHLIFRCGEVTYGIESSHVGEVVQKPRITHVPSLPHWVLGVTNLHGVILSVVDLGAFLNTQRASSDAPMMFLAKAEDQTIGLVVDDIQSIDSFPVASIFSPPFRIEPELVAYLRGVVNRNDQLIRLLDCERLLLSQQMQQFS